MYPRYLKGIKKANKTRFGQKIYVFHISPQMSPLSNKQDKKD